MNDYHLSTIIMIFQNLYLKWHIKGNPIYTEGVIQKLCGEKCREDIMSLKLNLLGWVIFSFQLNVRPTIAPK